MTEEVSTYLSLLIYTMRKATYYAGHKTCLYTFQGIDHPSLTSNLLRYMCLETEVLYSKLKYISVLIHPLGLFTSIGVTLCCGLRTPRGPGLFSLGRLRLSGRQGLKSRLENECLQDVTMQQEAT